MLRRFAVLTFVIPVLVGSGAWAADQTFSVGFIKPGMPLADLRSAAWPPGTELLCGTDDKLPEIDDDAGRTIMVSPRLKASGVIPCALFGKDKNGHWRGSKIQLGGNPASFWAMAVTGDKGEPPVLAEARLWQPKQSFDATVAYLTGRFGRPDESNVNAARWLSAGTELSVAHESKNGIITFLIDNRLRSMVIERLSKPADGAGPDNPKAPHGH